MPEVKLGNKYLCYSCGIKFYDLGKGEPICPKCGANQKDAGDKGSPAATAAKRKRKPEAKAKAVKKVIADELGEEPIVEGELEESLGDEELDTELVLGDAKDEADEDDEEDKDEKDDSD